MRTVHKDTHYMHVGSKHNAWHLYVGYSGRKYTECRKCVDDNCPGRAACFLERKSRLRRLPRGHSSFMSDTYWRTRSTVALGSATCVINLFNTELTDVFGTKVFKCTKKSRKLVQTFWRYGQSNLVASLFGPSCRCAFLIGHPQPTLLAPAGIRHTILVRPLIC